jgi:hypothetical protein
MAKKPKQAARLYGPQLQRPSNYVNPITPEMIEHMKNCEAREWIRRYKEKASTHGSSAAAAWWTGVLSDLQRIRGESATLDLRQRMKAQSENRT